MWLLLHADIKVKTFQYTGLSIVVGMDIQILCIVIARSRYIPTKALVHKNTRHINIGISYW